MADYLVRGALLACDHGTHARKLGLLESHGSYVCEKPQIFSEDCVVDTNINYFGICTFGNVPDSENVTLVKYGDEGLDGSTVTGCKCCPKIIGKWRNCKKDNVLNNVQVVTTDSYLVCQYGGLIEPISSGQEEE